MLSYALIILLLGAVSSSSNVTEEAIESRDFSGFNSASNSYDVYDNVGSFSSTDKWPLTSFQFPGFGGACGSGSLIRPLLVALIGAALIKIPFLLIAKFFLLKLALPFGLLAAAAPLAIPLGYLFLSKNKESTSSTPSTTTATAESRALHQFLESASCLERIACSLGHSQSRSSTSKTFSWMLKSLESVLGRQTEARSKVGTYRAAYINGASSTSENFCELYKCSLPEIVVRQGSSTYKIF